MPLGTRVWIAAGVTDLRKGMDGLAALVETALGERPFSGDVFAFRGKRGDLVKLLWWSGDGMNLYAKRLERGRFVWPQATSGAELLDRVRIAVAFRSDPGSACRIDPLHAPEVAARRAESLVGCVSPVDARYASPETGQIS